MLKFLLVKIQRQYDGEVMKYKAIALDLDGTLTDHNKKLPAKNIEAIY